MNGYLLDTNIISEYNREETPYPGVVKWIETTPETVQYLSVLTLGEIEKGILPAQARTASAYDRFVTRGDRSCA